MLPASYLNLERGRASRIISYHDIPVSFLLGAPLVVYPVNTLRHLLRDGCKNIFNVKLSLARRGIWEGSAVGGEKDRCAEGRKLL